MGASPAYARAAGVLGLVEMAWGVGILVFNHGGHDVAQGVALLAIGAGTFGSAPAFRSG